MEQEKFVVKFAETVEENNAAFRLRYNDMLLEYRPDVVRENGMDITPYDEFAKQAICIDNTTGEVVGCYRLTSTDSLPKGNQFVCEEEFDISALKTSGKRIIELSRAVVKKEYRNSMVLMQLLRFIVSYIREQGFRFVIGEASFLGVDKQSWEKELSYLAHYHAIEKYEITSLGKAQIELLPKETLDAANIKRGLPPLIRAYLGFGAKVSVTSCTDFDFGSVDIFILLDLEDYNETYTNRLLRL